MKLHVASEELREKTGLGSFSKLDGAGWRSCLIASNPLSSLGVDVEEVEHHLPVGGALWYCESSTEQDRWCGGAMAQAGLLDHFSGL